MNMRHDEIRQKYGKSHIPYVCFKSEWKFLDEKMLFKCSFLRAIGYILKI